MAANNDIKVRAREVRALVEDNQIIDAAQRLMDFVRDFSDDRENIREVTILSAELKRIERAARRRELPFEEEGRVRTPLLRQMLQLLDDIELSPKLPLPLAS